MGSITKAWTNSRPFFLPLLVGVVVVTSAISSYAAPSGTDTSDSPPTVSCVCHYDTETGALTQDDCGGECPATNPSK